jgi:hypothetical protein
LTITYTLLLENIGVLSDTAVLVTDTLPSGMTFVDWVIRPAGAMQSGNAITWTETISAGDRITLTFTADQTGDAGEAITNTARFSSTARRGSDDVVFTVAANQPPTADAGTDQAVSQGELVQLDGAASSDPDGHSLTYHWAQTGGSPQMTLSGNDVVSPTFTATDTGIFTFTLVVTDTFGLADTDEIAITITNQAPSADAGPDQTMKTNTTVTLDGSNSVDPDGCCPLAYRWTQTGGPAVSFTPNLSVTTFTAPTSTSVLTFSLAVTDTGDLSDTDEVVITVEAYHVYLPLAWRSN